MLTVHWGDDPEDKKTAVHQPIYMKEVASSIDEYLEELKKGNDEHIRMLLWPKFMREKTNETSSGSSDVVSSTITASVPTCAIPNDVK